MAGHATPTTLHHLTPYTLHLMSNTCLDSYSSTSLYHLTELTQYLPPMPVLTHTLVSLHHPHGKTRGIRQVEIKYLHAWSMPTRRDHSEYDPSRSPENPNSQEMLINRGVTHSLRRSTTVQDGSRQVIPFEVV
ncbi:hypothetical protein TIFTF001_028584 [Ficus carica]|uniref:Uncharacterized protein n=1 Tax=Ficus carica TaxID=3494 RepID=A0AA88DRK1_FICCA|nr:hypothetical protein TIFTF001_028584 [Ficus carica]